MAQGVECGPMTPVCLMALGAVVLVALIWVQLVAAGRAADAERKRDGG